MGVRDLFGVHFSPAVDKYLAREGAIAQAVDQNTIVVESSILKMSREERRLILLHELGHLQQLARPGNDPINSLEEEAWEAAYAWSEGKRFKIRGRARKRLNALAIVQGGDRGHPSARPWYLSNPVEPIGNASTITVNETIVLKDWTLENVMKTMIEKKTNEIVIVCHGLENSLDLSLVSGTALKSNLENISRLSADRSFKEGGLNTPIIRDEDVARQLSDDQVKGLRAKMNEIRQLKLDHIAFRACNLGKSNDILAAFRNLFGAASVSAPKLDDTYGQFAPTFGKDVKNWAESKRKAGFRVWTDLGVGLATGTYIKDSTKYVISSMAPDKSSFAAWAKKHVTDTQTSLSPFVFHGMKEKTENVPDQASPLVYFVRDASYAANIANYSG